ncbi:MAG: trypsin-like peptidase domain-containing protein [Planctomycetota bacterium]|nr:trypsin-like peptidase domain-containing protein [Planctomycetota bacterium]
MTRLHCLLLPATFVLANSLVCQSAQPMGRMLPGLRPLSSVAAFAVPAIDRVSLFAEDEQRRINGDPARYAVPYETDATSETHGSWEQVDPAWSLWRLVVQAPGASHINIGFTQCKLPATARLMLYSTNYQSSIRPFDRRDVCPDGQLWTPIVHGDEIVVEVYVQTAQRPQLDLQIGHVGSGYRFFGAGQTALAETDGSGACNIDVVCPQGAAWANEIPAIAAISSGGSIFCTGAMINNTAQDGRNFFLTANHCGVSGGTASSLVCFWNYENSSCNGPNNGPLTQFNTGSVVRAAYSPSDMTLVELNSSPNPAWGVGYAGWSRSTSASTSAVAIHHPSGDPKKISFENQPTQITSFGGTSSPGGGTHIRVVDWDSGTTEPGSSGSPLFDQNHRIIGQLHGGGAACGNNQSDWYGRLARSWTGGGTNSTRLSNWLDPIGTGAMTLDTLGSAGGGATATNYGQGCYEQTASFLEEFPAGSFDLSGTGSVPNVVRFTPMGTPVSGYAVAAAPPAWRNPTSADLGLGDDAVTPSQFLGFGFQYPGGLTAVTRMCSNGYVWLNGATTTADWSPTAAELVSEPARLCPLWMDLNPAGGGNTHFDVTPGAV